MTYVMGIQGISLLSLEDRRTIAPLKSAVTRFQVSARGASISNMGRLARIFRFPDAWDPKDRSSSLNRNFHANPMQATLDANFPVKLSEKAIKEAGFLKRQARRIEPRIFSTDVFPQDLYVAYGRQIKFGERVWLATKEFLKGSVSSLACAAACFAIPILTPVGSLALAAISGNMAVRSFARAARCLFENRVGYAFEATFTNGQANWPDVKNAVTLGNTVKYTI